MSLRWNRIGAAICLLFSSSTALAQTEGVVFPTLLEHVDAPYPPSKLEEHVEATVVLVVTVDTDGSVHDPQVAESGGDVFDRAALETVLTWRFTPASRAGEPVRSRIKVRMHFTPPPVTPPRTPPPAESSAPPRAVPPPPAPAPSSPPAAPPASHAEPILVNVIGRASPPNRGASDFRVEVGDLAQVPRKNAAALLTLTPGFFLTNEGGEGHAERVYLRGFDARAGQDIEFSVDGVPINESGNLHGNGFADLNFIIPETIREIRVLEGPFDPRQGNYAVAGSADFHLGVDERGVTAKFTAGSWSTQRLLLLWGPPGEAPGTFAAAEIYRTDGFGQNRDARRATAYAQYEGRLGASGSYRVGASAYLAEYHEAGLIREDDYETRRLGFYDTYDKNQGGSSSRYQIFGDLEGKAGAFHFHQQIFALRRTMRLREDFTGFLLDVQEPLQSLHDQRGDLFDLAVGETTLGLRGYARTEGRLFGQRQELEIGYFARGDIADGKQQRIDARSTAPYRTDFDLHSNLGDIGLWVDAALRPLRWLAIRGGVRADVFAFDVLDACAVKNVSLPSLTDPPVDQSCFSQQRGGEHREPDQRSTTASSAVMPRVSVAVGPFRSFTFSGSFGTGVRSIDPNYITQDVATPFAKIIAFEGGIAYAHSFSAFAASARSIVFGTHVDRDLVFSETEGRNVLGGGTTRAGWVGALRLTNEWLDESASVTLVKSVFDDTHLLVPYVPDVVARSDTSLKHELPLKIAGSPFRGALCAGVTYIGRRALPFGQRSDTIFTVDANLMLGWRGYELGVAATNLLGAQYRLAEYNFASDFRSAPDATLVPTRHFVAGAPRGVFVSLTANVGGSK